MKKLISMTVLALFVVVSMTGCKKNYTITVKSNNDAWGSVTGSGTYKDGETVTISAIPADGCYFNGWNDGNAENPRKIVVSGNAEYVATFSDTPGGGGGEPTGTVVQNAVTDVDGNSYDAVWIGGQLWMKENLRTTHYADGAAIPAGESGSSDTEPFYYDYSGSGIPLTERGYLYNWPAVMHGAASSNANPSGVQGICPSGWHVPSDAEWRAMINYVGSQSEYTCGDNSRYIAKALASPTGWNNSTKNYAVGNDQSTNNATGFTAVPAGNYNGTTFYNAGRYACFWTSTRSDNNNSSQLYLFYDYPDWTWSPVGKYMGYSVRCIRD